MYRRMMPLPQSRVCVRNNAVGDCGGLRQRRKQDSSIFYKPVAGIKDVVERASRIKMRDCNFRPNHLSRPRNWQKEREEAPLLAYRYDLLGGRDAEWYRQLVRHLL